MHFLITKLVEWILKLSKLMVDGLSEDLMPWGQELVGLWWPWWVVGINLKLVPTYYHSPWWVSIWSIKLVRTSILTITLRCFHIKHGLGLQLGYIYLSKVLTLRSGDSPSRTCRRFPLQFSTVHLPSPVSGVEFWRRQITSVRKRNGQFWKT